MGLRPFDTANLLERFIHDEVDGKTAIIGLSGGIDSSLVATLTAEAIGRNRVLGVMMPNEDTTDIKYAQELADIIKIDTMIVPITQGYRTMKENLPVHKVETLGNLQARLRMATLYAFSNELDGRVIGTTNKTEAMLGYFTKFGDGGVDIEPIINLYKTEVRTISKELGLPKSIIERPPTANLWHGQTDEDELGMPYEQIDRTLWLKSQGMDAERASRTMDYNMNKVASIYGLVDDNQHKLEMPKGGPIPVYV